MPFTLRHSNLLCIPLVSAAFRSTACSMAPVVCSKSSVQEVTMFFGQLPLFRML